ASLTSLQWGRDRTVAEMVEVPRVHPDVDRASMGPRPNGRGDGEWSLTLKRWPVASMGPRPNGRGDVSGGIPRRGQPRASMGPRPNGRGDRKAKSSRRRTG